MSTAAEPKPEQNRGFEMKPALQIARKLIVGCLALIGGFVVLGWAFEWLDWPIAHHRLPSVADRMAVHSGGTFESTIDKPEWEQRLRGRFEHLALSEMIAALQADGFRIEPDRPGADYIYPSFPCRFTFSVGWDATTDDTIRGLRGSIPSLCL